MDVKRLEEFGAEVKRIYGKGLLRGVDSPDGALGDDGSHPEWAISADHAVTFDRAVMMEGLTDGQRVRSYEIVARVGGKWKTVSRGTTIGHKKIDIFPPVTADLVRLQVTNALGPVRIREFNVYNGAAQ